MSSVYDRSARARPHDTWYNGNVDLMIENGTFEDHLEYLEELVAQNKLPKVRLENAKKKWAVMPDELKLQRYRQVIVDTTPQEMKLANGDSVLTSKPSNNGYREQKNKQKKNAMTPKRVPGAPDLTKSPLGRLAETKSVQQEAVADSYQEAISNPVSPDLTATPLGAMMAAKKKKDPTDRLGLRVPDII